MSRRRITAAIRVLGDAGIRRAPVDVLRPPRASRHEAGETPARTAAVLAKLLADNGTGNLTAKQVEFSQTIHAAGSDLLSLINNILDLSKVEAGKMDITPSPLSLDAVAEDTDRSFRVVAESQGLGTRSTSTSRCRRRS